MTKDQIKYRISKLMRAMDYHTDAIVFHKAEQAKILKKFTSWKIKFPNKISEIMPKRNSKNFIGQRIGKYNLYLIDPVKVMGHDDSLPFNTHWTIEDKNTGKVLAEGTAYDDGWGGTPVVNVDNGREVYDKANDYINATFAYDHQFVDDTVTIRIDLPDMIAILAELSVEPKSPNRGKLFSEVAFMNCLHS